MLIRSDNADSNPAVCQTIVPPNPRRRLTTAQPALPLWLTLCSMKYRMLCREPYQSGGGASRERFPRRIGVYTTECAYSTTREDHISHPDQAGRLGRRK